MPLRITTQSRDDVHITDIEDNLLVLTSAQEYVVPEIGLSLVVEPALNVSLTYTPFTREPLPIELTSSNTSCIQIVCLEPVAQIERQDLSFATVLAPSYHDCWNLAYVNVS